jgi:hypothetical protein
METIQVDRRMTMKQIMMGMMILLVLGLGGCGGDVSVSVMAPIPAITLSPALSGLDYGWTAERTILAGTVGFTAPDTDLDFMTVVISNNYGREVSRTTTDLRVYTGYTGGTVDFAIDTIAFLPGRYSFTLFVVDRSGNYSNPVYGDFVV